MSKFLKSIYLSCSILPFSNKADFGITKNYRGITLTYRAAEIYKALLRNHIELEIKKILWKNQDGFRKNRSTSSQIQIQNPTHRGK